MKAKNIQEKLNHYTKKINYISNLYNREELNISFDRLKNNKNVDYELLYFKESNNNEIKGIFVFSYDSFINELKNQEIKKILSQNFLNFRIYSAYQKISQKKKDIKINEIIEILSKEDSTLSRNRILNRIFTLAYYHNWDFKKDKNAIDSDYFIKIPDNFVKRPKQRFNMDIFLEIVNDNEVIFFINSKEDLVIVLKDFDKFNENDVKNITTKYLKDEFKIKKINYLNN